MSPRGSGRMVCFANLFCRAEKDRPRGGVPIRNGTPRARVAGVLIHWHLQGLHMMLFESLEQRRLLSVSFNPVTGLLTATETNLPDVVRVERSGKNLKIHEGRKTSSFTLAK